MMAKTNLKVIDLSNLREITRGNIATERMLFEAFIDVFSRAISNMNRHMDKSQENIWYEQAHFLKGTATNIGAERLAELLRAAEENYQMDKEKKLRLLRNIEAEFAEVKKALKN